MLEDARRTPPLEDLEAFVRVAESGSFTEAARRLHVPKSTVSRRIARLERTLSTPLVTRSSRRTALTEAGHAYLAEVGPALHRIDTASHAARDQREEPRGHLRVTAPFDVAMWWLAPLVTSFRERHPAVTVEVVVDERPRDLEKDGIDLAIRSAARLEDSALVARRLATIELALWASPAYLAARGRPESIEALSEHVLVASRSVQEKGRLSLHGSGGEREVPVHAAIGTNDLPFAHRVAVAGGGIAVLPSISPCGEAASLERVLPEWTVGTTSLFLVHAGGRLLPAKLRAFRDWLLSNDDSLTPVETCPKAITIPPPPLALPAPVA
jgi:DNA-binding transcriptional LysR family regulator